MNEVLEQMPFTYIRFDKREPRSTFFIRLTLPLYMIWYCLLLIGALVKWLPTGEVGYGYDSRIMKFTKSWWRVLNL